MHLPLRPVSAVGTILLAVTQVSAQTYSACNPLTSGGCPPNPALGRAVNVDLTQSSDSFTPQGSVSYGSDGAEFSVAQSGDSPQLMSKWYIMFGHVEFEIKSAPGAGVVSSAVLQSDCLDEIDWEWLGGDNNQVQSNYFGKGITTTYNRGAFHDAAGNHDDFHKYSIDWTSDQIVWQIDGVTVRAMTKENAAEGQYPQTPMMIKVGSWSGGDSANPSGTIAWAGGPTDYSAGPYTMYVKSIAVTDYSTGMQYTYSGTDGTWQSITSEGGKINPEGGSNTPTDTSDAPAVTSSAANVPIPFEGTHREESSSWATPNVWPWVGSATATLATSLSPEQYPSSPASAYSSGSGLEVLTRWDQRGFPVLVTVNADAPSAPPSYDQQGFLVTPTDQPTASMDSAGAAQTDGSGNNNFEFPSAVSANKARETAVWTDFGLVIAAQVAAAVMAV